MGEGMETLTEFHLSAANISKCQEPGPHVVPWEAHSLLQMNSIVCLDIGHSYNVCKSVAIANSPLF